MNRQPNKSQMSVYAALKWLEKFNRWKLGARAPESHSWRRQWV